MSAVDIVGEQPTPVDDPPTGDASPDVTRPIDAGWRRALWHGFAAYLLSRVLVLAGLSMAAAGRSGDETRLASLSAVLRAWDGEWYLSVVRGGYPSHIPAGIDSAGRWDEARVGFFPLYPSLVRTVDVILPGDALLAALAVGLVLGAVVVFLVGGLAREWFGTETARRAMILTALLPGSVVLTLVYSEGLLIALAAGCLLALHRRHWWLAGTLAALATATRPNGIALVAACAVAAMEAIRLRREWRALAAPLLAPLGLIAFHAYLRLHTGQDWVWFRVQAKVWEEHYTFGASTAWQVRNFVTQPGRSWEDLLATATVIAAIVLLGVAWRLRISWPAFAYSGVVLALMVLPSTVTARPRFLFTAFPLIIALAQWWPDETSAWARRGWRAFLAASALALVGVTVLYGGYDVVP
jgi:hypothetical protein